MSYALQIDIHFQSKRLGVKVSKSPLGTLFKCQITEEIYMGIRVIRKHFRSKHLFTSMGIIFKR